MICFIDATAFNGNISLWNTAAVTTMTSMFHGATAFNQDISSWNTAAVTTMSICLMMLMLLIKILIQVGRHGIPLQ